MAETRRREHESIYVAPLKLLDSKQKLHIHTSTISRNRKAGIYSLITSQAQMTPPLTPYDSQESTANEEDDLAQPIFHNYIRAHYEFNPPETISSTTVTVPLREGDIVLVHSIHTNGWADGTVLSTGSRGWLPTNYCEAFEPGAMRNLFQALTGFWDQVANWDASCLKSFSHQNYMHGIIAGVRVLLERTGCLNRDSVNVRTHEELKRARKALLSELSALVKTAKSLEGLGAGVRTNDDAIELLNDMLLRAYKLVTRGVRFLDVWADVFESDDQFSDGQIDGCDTEIAKGQQGTPPTPPVDAADAEAAQLPATNPSAACDSNSQNPAQAEDDTPSGGIRQQTDGSTLSSRRQSTINDSNRIGTNAGEASRSKTSPRPVSLQAKRISVTHRISYTGQTPGSPRNTNLASERLGASHDAFLGSLGSFIGLHMQSRPSSDLISITQQATASCQTLLDVVKVVLEHDPDRSDYLTQAHQNMYEKLSDLVQVARQILKKTEDGAVDEDVLLPDEGSRLVGSATACVRSAGECVARTRYVLEKIGDFEFEPFGLHIPDFEAFISRLASEKEDAVKPKVSVPTVVETILEKPLPPPPGSSQSFPENHTPSDFRVLNHGRSPSTGSLICPLPHLDSPESTPKPETPEKDSLPTANETPIELSKSRKDSEGHISVPASSINSTAASTGSAQVSEDGGPSQSSTRATSLERSPDKEEDAIGSHNRSTTMQSTPEECEDAEAKILEKTFAHELIFNKEGQITGGSLEALIERLTTHDSTPDALFVSTFYLTFRLFVTPMKFAEALVDRFDYVGDTPGVALPVRLRVYNVFKGWMESHWRHDCDNCVLDFILSFAKDKLNPALPGAGQRLAELAKKVSAVHGPTVPRLISSIGKTNTAAAQYIPPDTPLPVPIITRSSLNSLRNWKNTGAAVSILDFDPLELARQITLKVSRVYCSILPEELLAMEWMKKSGSLAVNVRAMSRLSTDFANLVADSILVLEDMKKRSRLIKHWIKIASKCLELNNYDSLMAIVCSLNSSTIARLKLTWEVVSPKTKAMWEELKSIMDVSRNYANLRQKLNNCVPPCIPFVGMYLTDLTFVEEGNQTTRQLYCEGSQEGMAVINFDKHVRTARIISELQRFQVPYRLTEIPELQTWMQDQLVRVQSNDPKDVQKFYRRSLLLEPREQINAKFSASRENQHESTSSREGVKDKFEFLSWSHITREKSIS